VDSVEVERKRDAITVIINAAKPGVVIQVSDDSPKTWNQSLNVVKNLQSAYGKDKVDIELVVFGNGSGLLKFDSPLANRIDETLGSGESNLSNLAPLPNTTSSTSTLSLPYSAWMFLMTFSAWFQVLLSASLTWTTTPCRAVSAASVAGTLAAQTTPASMSWTNFLRIMVSPLGLGGMGRSRLLRRLIPRPHHHDGSRAGFIPCRHRRLVRE